jgi:hypothetical protein
MPQVQKSQSLVFTTWVHAAACFLVDCRTSSSENGQINAAYIMVAAALPYSQHIVVTHSDDNDNGM